MKCPECGKPMLAPFGGTATVEHRLWLCNEHGYGDGVKFFGHEPHPYRLVVDPPLPALNGGSPDA
jgi:hypothetical protein